MRRIIKKYFIPHEGNNFHPHILHTKRTVFYGLSFLLSKGIIIFLVALFPVSVFTLPDVVAGERKKIIDSTNELRAQYGLAPLQSEMKLFSSSEARAVDMAQNEYFDHIGPDDQDLNYFLTKANYDYYVAGENLAMGFVDADDIVKAWEESISHRDNLIDTQYKDFGLSIQPGRYQSQDTIFTVLHFGLSKISTSTALSESMKKNLNYKPRASEVFWYEDGKDIRFLAKAQIEGNVKSATVYIGKYEVELNQVEENNYLGDLRVEENADDFFKVILVPTIRIVGEKGGIIEENIKWQTIRLPKETILQKYARARDRLFNYFAVFSVSRNIYIGFIIFFTLALLINVIIEIKIQHHHVIAQTLGLITLLICLTVF